MQRLIVLSVLSLSALTLNSCYSASAPIPAYRPQRLPSNACVPNNDPLSRRDLGC